ncbi:MULTISPECIES: ABC transporter permease [unclassified Kitasatospora]|uniref:ABC transporter permease n=1 Tax=unclassified Kitasatospora TaxID=2633591 RepID=UPI0007103793|nr:MULTISPECIES: ABC transporter permease [unclassified Kitasatospora]KQV21721.1 ABC transporter [Kitasatospora sp. Root107]KRB75486.1 ABC transporter [Kitasatospora sp. Root187]
MLHTALRNVFAHRGRLVMTALAIMLGVAFVFGTLVFGDTVTHALRGASAKNLKDVAVSVQATSQRNSDSEADDGRSTALTDELADRVRALPGVTSVHPTVNGTATLAAKDGRPLNADNSWQNLAANYSPDAPGSDRDSRFPVSAGRGPTAGGELALDRRTAEKAGYAIGDSVRFATTGPALTKKLVGTVDTDDPRVTAGGSLALFDTGTAQQLFLQAGRFDELAVGSAPGTDNQELTGRIRALLPTEGITVTSGAQLAHEQAERIAESTKALTRMLLAFAGIALFVGAFVIANTFTMLIAQRSRETALLRAVGASRRQVVRAVLAEAGLLGLGASAAGIGLGIGIATALRPLLNASGAGLPDGPLVISPDALVRSLLVGVGVTVLAAWLPSRRAAKVAPVEALTTVDQTPPRRGLVLRNSLGVLLTGLGVLVLLYVSTQTNGADSNLKAAGLGSVLTLTGMIVIAPLLSRPLIRLAGAVTTRFFGVSGKLAEENALRNPRRTAATASALMIGLTLITGLSVTGSSMNAALKAAAVAGLTADYQVSNTGSGGIDPALGTKVAEVPGVAESVPLASSTLGARGEFATLTGADPQRLGRVSDLKFSSGSLADLGPGKVALSDKLAKATGLAKGDTFQGTVGYGHGEKALTVVGVYQQTRAVGSALGTMDEVLPYANGGRLESILVKAASGRHPNGLDQDIRAALGNSPLLQVQNQEQLTKAQSGEIGAMLNMMYGLLGMTVVIAVFGVVNTLAMSVFERTREIGLLRAIGLGTRGVRQMVRLESVVISLFGAALGIGTGIFLAWACGSLSKSSLPQYEIVLPWARLGLFLLLSLAIGVLAAVWPARRAARLNILRAINAA